MKMRIENLGVLKQAEFELGGLTLICGGNNTGKTYATYALFGFLFRWQDILKVDIPEYEIKTLLNDGVVRIDVTLHAVKANAVLEEGCRAYSQQLSDIFASKPAHFKGSRFQVKQEAEQIPAIVNRAFERRIRSSKSDLFSLTKAKGEKDLVVSLLMNTEEKIELPTGMVENVISGCLTEILFGRFFPEPFIASAERTGAAIFRKELNFARNRLLEEMSRPEKDIDPLKLLFKSYQDYALPVKINVDFTRQLETIAKQDSFLATEHPGILNEFADIIGGEYITGANDTLYFKPAQRPVKLAMDECSSAVRSMLDIGFYLRHVAKPRDLLMVDEPELNLHPENQRRIARLFARLVNIGIRVFMTTHSDYIVKELNTLIMLKQDQPRLMEIAARESYQTDELLDADKIRVYIAEKASIKLANNTRRSQCQTLVLADIDPKWGIEARSFDETINKMNEIQDAIVWGGDT